MPKKKSDPQNAIVFAKKQAANSAQTEPGEAAPDEETQHGVEESTPEPEPPGSDLSDSEPIEGTRALRIRPANPKVSTVGRPLGNTTRPIAIDSLQLAENRDIPRSPSHPSDSPVPDGTQAIPKRSHNSDTGPLPSEPPPPSRYKTVAQDLPQRPSSSSAMPAWAWALIGGVGALALAGVGIFLYQHLTVPVASDNAQEASAPEASAAPSMEAASPEAEVPIALRSYIEKSKTGSDRDRGLAMATLGTMYAEGLNVEKDEKKGREWYEKAAELKSKTAEKWLSDHPATGK